MREVFPLHDALCEEEGQWMLKYIEGDASAAQELAQRSGRVEQLWKKILGR